MKGAFPLVPIIAIVAVLALLGVINIPMLSGGQAFSITGPVGSQPQVGGPIALQCQTDGTNTLNVATRNALSTTATLYTRSSIAAVNGGDSIFATATSDGSSSLTYTALNIDCDPAKLKGQAWVLSGTAAPGTLVNSKNVDYDLTGKLTHSVIMDVKNVTRLRWTIRNTALANTSETTSTSDSANETAATAMGANAVRSGFIDFDGLTGNAQFGSDDNGILWVIDTAASAVFSDKAISIGVASAPAGWTLTEVDCPTRAQSFDSGNRCYKSPPVKTSDGLYRLSWTISADLGDPGTTADPFLYAEDVQCFDQDGKITCNTHDKGGTQVGVARQQIGWDNS